MPKLYIIGNGFDLSHQLETSYEDFCKYLQQNFQDLMYKMDEYFSFKVSEKYLWTDFENDLGTFNFKAYFGDLNEIDVLHESFKPSEVYSLEDEMQQEIDRFIDEIRTAFTNWISELDISLGKVKNIKFSNKDYFINFNYTETLEELYNINTSKIFYIHNKANNYMDLTFGHGEINERYPKDKELNEEGDSNRTLFTEAENIARYPFYAFQKKTNKVLENHYEEFNKFNDCNEIFILGHALGKVDLPYFRKIKEMLPNASWKISYYSNNEKLKLKSIAIELGIKKNNISMIKISDLE
ncbi:bacteriophage abortive infection AbiH family protein [Elizabethkingia meningoseptica]|uniref:bacteriophage abortive infection AbiH family protein n=1 Tax=Elizabethkingia meningoseptica TaxID=238 RepID=UPI002DD6B24D|nr:bacteriophage abortive infection AbiH family protein [Elizabethkingia meningoseptica]MEC4711063.1 bacteriophage abortive infection AbiH family protein [Elizabethkingia meningoseptica]